MTTKAIEAGARACYDKFNENLIGCCEPTWDELPEDFRHRLTDAFDAGVKAAIASGALVPASATKPYSSAEFLTSPEALDEYVKEMVASAVAAERERCAALIDAECERVLSKQTQDADPLSMDGSINFNLRITAVLLPELSAAIRALPPAPASGEFVVVPRKLTPDMIVQGYEHVSSDLCEGKGDALDRLWTAMLSAATKDGERK